jgi:hypothetical protein
MEDYKPPQKSKVFRVKTDFDEGVEFEEKCKNENTNVNAKLKEFIRFSLKGQKKYFSAGKNKINYKRANNMFNWTVVLDSGKTVEIAENLSDNFLKNLRKEIDNAMQERNDWLHNRTSDSVAIPSDLLGDNK